MPETDHDIIFRKVRGILNKLTPEKFQKLSDDLLGLQLDSDKVLKGVILLIFEKALDEPKYSSMYAQLCKRLSEEAPNFEPPGQPCTFKLLLLNKCRTEFENRAQTFAEYEDKILTPEEEEKRHLAKCKMLGNIKFIGELGKLEILAESILHRCIQKLLARRAAAEHHEDLECLAQLVRTCGRVLDSERGRGLMDQYFARIDTLCSMRELAPRIRFMLRDVAELRRGGWVPRQATHASPPVPIQQLRDEPPRRQDPLFRSRPRPLDDVLAGLTLAPPARLFPRHGGGGRDGGRDGRDGRDNRDRDGQRRDSGPPSSGPRPRRAPASAALADLQMRPAANSLLFSATRRDPPPNNNNTHSLHHNHAPSLGPAQFAPPLVKDPPALPIKPAPDAKQKTKKDKGGNKEEAVRLALEAMRALTTVSAAALEKTASEASENGEAGDNGEAGEAGDVGLDEAMLAAVDDPPESLRQLMEMHLPDKMMRQVMKAVLEAALVPEEEEAEEEAPSGGGEGEGEGAVEPEPSTEGLARALAACGVALVARRLAGDALRAVVTGARGGRAALAAAGVARGLASLGELAGWLEAAPLRPLLLPALQALRRLLGEARLQALVRDADLNVCAFVDAAESERALQVLEARGLAELVPQLRAAAALARQLAREPQPQPLYRWIKANVEVSVRQSPAFVSSLVALVARHVWGAAGSSLDREKALLEEYAPLLRALLAGKAPLQLAAVYAVQVHAHQHRYPKGMLLRWFMYLYNLEVCEEEAFLRWREDVTDAYPGKGEALFQVNAWLTWLQQQESEEEEAED